MASKVCKWSLAHHKEQLPNASITQKKDMAINITFLLAPKLQNEADRLGRCVNLPNGVLCTFLVSFLLVDACIEAIQ